MNSHKSPLELLKKFLNNSSSEKAQSLLKKYDEALFSGPTVIEYFNEVESVYSEFFSFFETADCSEDSTKNIVDIKISAEEQKGMFTCEDSVILPSKGNEYEATSFDSSYCLAA